MNFILPADYKLLCTFSVAGNLPRKSNNRQLIFDKKTGKPRIIKNKAALAYSKDFADNIPEALKDSQFTGDLLIVANIYYSSWRPDLSDELLCDLLQAVGVVKNDRSFMEKILSKQKDAENPRVEVWIYQINNRTPITVGVEDG